MPFPNVIFSPRSGYASCILPFEILLRIVDEMDSDTLAETCVTCTQLSNPTLERLWRSLHITGVAAFEHLQSLSSSVLDRWVLHLAIRSLVAPSSSHAALKIPCQLQVLRMHQVDMVIDQASLARAKALISLEFSRCSVGTVNNVISRHLPAQLSQLVLHDCPVTDQHLLCVAAACSQLVDLIITGSGIVSDEGLVAVAAANPNMQNITIIPSRTIVQSNTITVATIEAVTAHCPRLMRFVCPNQSRIATTATLERLKLHCTFLEVCDLRHTLIPESPYYEKPLSE